MKEKDDYQKWVITREFSLKILAAAFNSLEKKEEFVQASKKVEKLLYEFEQKIIKKCNIVEERILLEKEQKIINKLNGERQENN